MTAAPIRVVVVEDNDMYRETLELVFAPLDEIEVVGSAASGDLAPDLCAELVPDVVLMDYRMPGLNGAEATQAVLAACPTASVVCLTASVTSEEVAEVLSAGAVAVVTKDENFDSLVQAVRDAGLR